MPDAQLNGRRVAIIGRHSLQLRLLADVIGERLGHRCELRAPATVDPQSLAPDALILLDLESLPAKQHAALALALVQGAPQRQLVLFNVDDIAALQHIVLWPGVRGIFSRDVPHEQLLKGIQAVLAGEYWLPRKLLTAYLEQSRARRNGNGANGAALTPKETATLLLLMRGSSNSGIARELKVSTHTVKTHLYNLFRKIRVSNRVQAVQWATSHIDLADGEAR